MDRAASSSSSARLWVAVFAPGLVCVVLGALVLELTALWVLGLVLLVAPLVVQMFGPDWDRETIPEGHHHDGHSHHGHGHSDHAHHDDAPRDDLGGAREHSRDDRDRDAPA